MSSAATSAAFRIDGAPASREAFYAAACDPHRSVVVEACAGAGKTWILVSRILRALLDGVPPHRILAITFTRKAAGEMRERVAQGLRELALASHRERVCALIERGLDQRAAEQLAPRLETLHDRVLDSGRSVEVLTFHAWFAQLLRCAPIEILLSLGLRPQMALIEDLGDLRPELFRRFHAAVLADPSLHQDYHAQVAACGRSTLRRWLERAWDKRIEIERADAIGALLQSVPSAGALWPQFAALDTPAAALQAPVAQARWRSLAGTLVLAGPKAAATAHTIEHALNDPDPQATFDTLWQALFTAAGEPRQHLPGSPSLHEALAEMHRLRDAIEQQRAHLAHARMVRLARTLLAEYAALKRRRGVLDMDDLEQVACTLLGDEQIAGWIQERLDTRLRHLLIDEFQDTSPLQWHAMHAWLSAYAGAGGGASGQRPLILFIVGDPKQSIYRFRRAEPRVFDAARNFVAEALAGQILECDHTRRSAPALLDAVNATFTQAQQAGVFDGFRQHTSAIDRSVAGGVWALPRIERPVGTKTDSGAGRQWRPSLTPRREPEQVLREREAAQLAAAVCAWRTELGIAPGEMFVLCRKRESLRLVADALQAAQLPFVAPEDTLLAAQPEVRDLIALLDALASPQHELSLAQALKSPLFGLSDDELLVLATAAPRCGGWWQALMQGAVDNGAAGRRARDLLSRWAQAARVLPPHDLLDRVVAEGELLARLAAVVPAPRWPAALQAVNALLAQALQLDGGRYATPYNFVRALRRCALKYAPDARTDAVQLLTVHGAKGLEARVVFLVDADPEPKNAETATLLVDWPVDAMSPRLVAFIASEARCPPSLRALLAQEQAARAREELNGLYVAMTRARERFVLSSTEPYRKPEQPSWWSRVAGRALAWSAAAVAEAPARGAVDAEVPVLPTYNGTRAGVAPGAVDSAPESDPQAARLGQALHRLLEWAAHSASARGSAEDRAFQAMAAAREFGLPLAQAHELQRLADQVLDSPECARFFVGSPLRWAANEMPIAYSQAQGARAEVLRIDRVVLLQEQGVWTWWVLDYKLKRNPAGLAQYRDQLERYRHALQALVPSQRVRAAFITGGGKLVEP